METLFRATSLILMAFLLVWTLYGIFVLDIPFLFDKVGNTEIHSKTPIEPELHIVVSGGELDTTFVYRRK